MELVRNMTILCLLCWTRSSITITIAGYNAIVGYIYININYGTVCLEGFYFHSSSPLSARHLPNRVNIHKLPTWSTQISYWLYKCLIRQDSPPNEYHGFSYFNWLWYSFPTPYNNNNKEKNKRQCYLNCSTPNLQLSIQT